MENKHVTVNSPMLLSWADKPLETLRNLKTETMLQAIKSPSMSVGMLNRFKPGLSIILLKAMIAEVSLFLNLGKNMTPEQIKQTAELILTDIESKNMKPEDFKVMFDNAKKGLYGKAYDRLDGQVIFEWVRLYTAERMALCEQKSIKEHNQVKKQSNVIGPEMVEFYKEIAKTLPKVVEEHERKPEPKKKPEKSPKDILVQLLFKEFFDLWAKKPHVVSNNSDKKFVKIDGKILDEVEYVEYKLKEHDTQGQG